MDFVAKCSKTEDCRDRLTCVSTINHSFQSILIMDMDTSQSWERNMDMVMVNQYENPTTKTSTCLPLPKVCTDDVDCRKDETCQRKYDYKRGKDFLATTTGYCKVGEVDEREEYDRIEKQLPLYNDNGYRERFREEFRVRAEKWLKEDEEYRKKQPKRTRAGRELDG